MNALPLPTPTLADTVVRLRPWRAPDDLAAVEEAAADPSIPASTSIPAHYTPEAGVAWIARQQAKRLSGTSLVLAVVDPVTDTAHGMVGLMGVDLSAGHAELGYWVAPHARGRGLAARAAALLTEWAWSTLPLVRVDARIAVDNVPSQRAAERAGLRREGVLRASYRIGGAWMDMAMYAAVRPGTPTLTWTQLQSGAVADPTGSAGPTGSSVPGAATPS